MKHMNLDAEKGRWHLATSSTPSRRDRKEGKKKRRIWPWILLLVCVLAAAAAGWIFASSSLLDKPKPNKVEQQKEKLLTAHDKATIMIMGVDERVDDVGRSDTLMLATIDPDRNKAALLSIPRDTRVRISGYGYDKINAAFAYGGERLTQSTVENFLGVDIDHYVIINTRAFVKIIDAIGGIDINVEKRMYYEDPWDDDGGLVIDLYPGLQHMDGKTAVTYVRYRDEEGDIGRIKRQQKFMQACMDKITSPAILISLPSVIKEVIGSVRTDLSIRQLLEFAGTLKEAQANGLQTEMVPGRPLYIDEVSYWIPDVGEIRSSLARMLGITVNNTMRSDFERAAREYEDSIPSNATEVPESDNSIGHAVRSSDLEQERTEKEKRKGKEPQTGKNKDNDGGKNKDTDRREQDVLIRNDPRRQDTQGDSRDTVSRDAKEDTDSISTRPEGVPALDSSEAPSRAGDGIVKTR